MRWDRFVSLKLVQPVLSRLGGDRGKVLPVLMYHSISDDDESEKHPYYRVCTGPERFSHQMDWLGEMGYVGVTLERGMKLLEEEGSEDLKPVAITFDDGFRDFATAAMPALRRHGFHATMYLPTAFIGDERREFNGRLCLTWGEIRELSQEGVEFGSHTVNHPQLTDLDWAEIDFELRHSREVIEKKIEAQVRSFAYPYAFPQADIRFVSRFREVLRDTGYRFAVTTQIETVRDGSDSFLGRLPVNGADDRDLLLAKLSSSYDWLGRLQFLKKRLRGS